MIDMAQPVQPDGRITKLIPYRNPKALIGYYLGFVGLIPLAGFPFGVAAMVLGIMGILDASADPHAKGRNHAIVALVLGIVSVTLCMQIGAATLMLLYLAKFLSSLRMPATPTP
jgi:hypothetical protein